jgi:hypothetical protein
MEIRFRVDQAEAFRRGINVPGPIVPLNVDPAVLPESQRKLIGKHLLGTDVVYDPKRATEEYGGAVPIGGYPPYELVETEEPNLESLLNKLQELES